MKTINTNQNSYLIWIKFSTFYVKTKRKFLTKIGWILMERRTHKRFPSYGISITSCYRPWRENIIRINNTD